MTQAKYTRRSWPTLSGALAELGHVAGPDTVADLLRDLGYRLRVNVKRLSGPYHPDREEQFTFIEGLVAAFREEGLPILVAEVHAPTLLFRTWRVSTACPSLDRAVIVTRCRPRSELGHEAVNATE